MDANIFFDWHVRFPPDLFPGIVKEMEAAALAGRIVAPQEVRNEIDRLAPLSVKTWVKGFPMIFKAHSVELQAAAKEILRQFPELLDPTANYDEADAFVIALAKLNKFTVVSHETRAHAKPIKVARLFVPDVCDKLNIKCVNLLNMMRGLGWKF